jgi:tRNA 2-thiouridine synthesizing protein A
MEFNQELDATGLLCPEPVMMLHEKMPDMESGEILKVLATDPSTTRDIPQFCRFLGHTLLGQEEEGDLFVYFIQRV